MLAITNIESSYIHVLPSFPLQMYKIYTRKKYIFVPIFLSSKWSPWIWHVNNAPRHLTALESMR